MRYEKKDDNVTMAKKMAGMYIKLKDRRVSVYEDLGSDSKVLGYTKPRQEIHSDGHLLGTNDELMFLVRWGGECGFISRNDIEEWNQWGFNAFDRNNNLRDQLSQIQILLTRVRKYMEDPNDSEKVKEIQKQLEELRDADLSTIYTN